MIALTFNEKVVNVGCGRVRRNTSVCCGCGERLTDAGRISAARLMCTSITC